MCSTTVIDPLGDDWLSPLPVDPDTESARAELLAELDALWPPADLLDTTAPGPGLAGLVDSTCIASSDGARLVALVAACDRLGSWVSSVQLAATDALTDAAYGWEGVGRDVTQVDAHEMAAHEVGAACRLSPPAARARVELAHALRRLPLTRLALAAGRIDLAKAPRRACQMVCVRDLR